MQSRRWPRNCFGGRSGSHYKLNDRAPGRRPRWNKSLLGGGGGSGGGQCLDIDMLPIPEELLFKMEQERLARAIVENQLAATRQILLKQALSDVWTMDYQDLLRALENGHSSTDKQLRDHLMHGGEVMIVGCNDVNVVRTALDALLNQERSRSGQEDAS